LPLVVHKVSHTILSCCKLLIVCWSLHYALHHFKHVTLSLFEV
jgi:hypothetical protein